MPFLEEVQPDTTSLCRIEELLRLNVWNRPPKGNTGYDWPRRLAEKIRTPAYPGDFLDDIVSLTHGDCTVSNLMRGPGGYVLVDALPPREHVAQSPYSDMGRILQSAAGWETFRYGQEIVDYEAPMFWKVDQIRRRALWWCGATALRIAIFNDPSPELVVWCNKVAEVSFDAARI